MERSKQFWVDKLGKDWTVGLRDILKSPYMDRLLNFLAMENALKDVYPHADRIFNNFLDTPLADVRIIIIAKEPGIDFSIFPEIIHDAYIDSHYQGNYRTIYECIIREYESNSFLNFEHTLEAWAKQGVLYLPMALTVANKESGSHLVQWKRFVEAVMELIKAEKPGTIFFLWGNEAKKYTNSLHNQHIFSWESPSDALKENRDWHCPNFKQADKLITQLNGDSFKITW